MFSVNKLRRDSTNPLPGQKENSLPEVNIIGNIK